MNLWVKKQKVRAICFNVKLEEKVQRAESMLITHNSDNR